MQPLKPKVWGKMLWSSWETLSVTGLGKGKGEGKMLHQKSQRGISPTPSSTCLLAFQHGQCGELAPGIQQFLHGVPQTCLDRSPEGWNGLRLPSFPVWC